MNVLEKILAEIEHEAMTNKEIGRKQCEGMARAANIIRSHMDVPDTNIRKWIPVEERLPKEEMPVWITVKHSSWISDYGSDFIPKEEWMHHPESRGTHKGKYEEGIWWYEDEENEWIRCDEPGEERDIGVVYSTVIAWQPYTEPEPYQSNVPEANQNIAYQFFRNRFEGVK